MSEFWKKYRKAIAAVGAAGFIGINGTVSSLVAAHVAKNALNNVTNQEYILKGTIFEQTEVLLVDGNVVIAKGENVLHTVSRTHYQDIVSGIEFCTDNCSSFYYRPKKIDKLGLIEDYLTEEELLKAINKEEFTNEELVKIIKRIQEQVNMEQQQSDSYVENVDYQMDETGLQNQEKSAEVPKYLLDKGYSFLGKIFETITGEEWMYFGYKTDEVDPEYSAVGLYNVTKDEVILEPIYSFISFEYKVENGDIYVNVYSPDLDDSEFEIYNVSKKCFVGKAFYEKDSGQEVLVKKIYK